MANGNVTRVKVTISAERQSSSSPIRWSYACDFQPPHKGSNNGDRMKIKGEEPAEITFDLDDRTGLQLRFKHSAEEAIWIQEGIGCPSGPGDGAGEFILDTKPSNKRLTITDRNSREAEFHYRLWFDSANEPEDYDPIIINRA